MTPCLATSSFNSRLDSSLFEDMRVCRDVGPQFFLLASVSNLLWFDGLSAFASPTSGTQAADPYAAFYEAALRKRGERRPKKPRVTVANIEDLLLSATGAFPLVTIHREQIDPERWLDRQCKGREPGARFAAGNWSDATWEETSQGIECERDYSGAFGGDYENALLLVGGEPAAAPARTERK